MSREVHDELNIFKRSKANEKYTIMTPFNVINKMLGPYLFSATARESLGDKMELYFHDPSFVPLFMQVSSCIIDISNI